MKHRPTRDRDIAVALSDQLTIGEPVNVAISIGDIILGVGIVHFAYAGSRSRRRVRPPARFVDLPAAERLEADEAARTVEAQTRDGAPTARSSASNTLRS